MSRIYFATNRRPTDPGNPTSFEEGFNGPPPGQLLFGVADVASPPGRTFDDRPIEADDPSAVTLSDVGPDNFSAAVKAQILGGADHLVVSIHGFQYLFWESVVRAEYLSRWLAEGRHPNPSTVILFAWPSAGRLLRYGDDWEVAGASGGAAARFLSTLTALIAAFREAKGDRARVTLLTHSMGNHVLASALESAAADAIPRLDQIVLVAADEARSALVEGGALLPTLRLAQRVSVYYNNQDIPLMLSSGLYHGVIQRLGIDGPPRKRDFKGRNIAFVNASAVNFGSVNDPKDSQRHQYYRLIHEVRDDICAVMRGLADSEIPNREYRDDPSYGWEHFWQIRAVTRTVGV